MTLAKKKELTYSKAQILTKGEKEVHLKAAKKLRAQKRTNHQLATVDTRFEIEMCIARTKSLISLEGVPHADLPLGLHRLPFRLHTWKSEQEQGKTLNLYVRCQF